MLNLIKSTLNLGSSKNKYGEKNGNFFSRTFSKKAKGISTALKYSLLSIGIGIGGNAMANTTDNTQAQVSSGDFGVSGVVSSSSFSYNMEKVMGSSSLVDTLKELASSNNELSDLSKFSDRKNLYSNFFGFGDDFSGTSSQNTKMLNQIKKSLIEDKDGFFNDLVSFSSGSNFSNTLENNTLSTSNTNLVETTTNNFSNNLLEKLPDLNSDNNQLVVSTNVNGVSISNNDSNIDLTFNQNSTGLSYSTSSNNVNLSANTNLGLNSGSNNSANVSVENDNFRANLGFTGDFSNISDSRVKASLSYLNDTYTMGGSVEIEKGTDLERLALTYAVSLGGGRFKVTGAFLNAVVDAVFHEYNKTITTEMSQKSFGVEYSKVFSNSNISHELRTSLVYFDSNNVNLGIINETIESTPTTHRHTVTQGGVRGGSKLLAEAILSIRASDNLKIEPGLSYEQVKQGSYIGNDGYTNSSFHPSIGATWQPTNKDTFTGRYQSSSTGNVSSFGYERSVGESTTIGVNANHRGSFNGNPSNKEVFFTVNHRFGGPSNSQIPLYRDSVDSRLSHYDLEPNRNVSTNHIQVYDTVTRTTELVNIDISGIGGDSTIETNENGTFKRLKLDSGIDNLVSIAGINFPQYMNNFSVIDSRFIGVDTLDNTMIFKSSIGGLVFNLSILNNLGTYSICEYVSGNNLRFKCVHGVSKKIADSYVNGQIHPKIINGLFSGDLSIDTVEKILNNDIPESIINQFISGEITAEQLNILAIIYPIDTTEPEDPIDEDEGLSDLEKIHIAYNNLTIPGDLNNIISNINLITFLDDVSIVWESSNSNVLSSNGIVNRPAFGEGNSYITLTANLIIGSESMTKIFFVRVLELEEVIPNAPSEAPVILSEGGLTKETSHIVNVSPLNGATSYEYRLNNGAWSETVNTSIDINLDTGDGNYLFEVRGKNAGGVGPISSLTYSLDTVPPSVLTLLSESPNEQGTIYFGLQASSNEELNENMVGQSGNTEKGGSYIITGITGNIITFNYNSPSGLAGPMPERRDTISFVVTDLAGNGANLSFQTAILEP